MRLLPWLCARFDLPPPIVLMRHPCAVVSSQLRSGWPANKPELERRYIAQYPKFKNILESVKHPEEILAAKWAMDQLPALLHEPPHPWILVTYEELLR